MIFGEEKVGTNSEANTFLPGTNTLALAFRFFKFSANLFIDDGDDPASSTD